MDKASGRSLQLSVFQPQLFKSLFPNWTKIELTRLALTILKKIGLLHDHNILVGDLNPFNINVVNQNEIYFLDTDSFQIDNYPCPVGTIDFTAPEIQGVNFTSFLRKKEHEYYAIATLLFMIFSIYSLNNSDNSKDFLVRIISLIFFHIRSTFRLKLTNEPCKTL